MSMNTPISIMLVDDHALVREALTRTLHDEPDLKVVGTAGDAGEAIAEVKRLKPDIILMDIDMPGQICFEAAKTIETLSPHSRIIYLSAFFNDRYIEQALAVEASGYVTKSEPPDVLADAIRQIARGRTYYSPDIQSRIIADDEGSPRLAKGKATPISTLTHRELEVLRYVGRGMTKQQIAETMYVSVHTAHRHIANVMAKLDIHDRTDLARYAIREGLAEA